jgi:NTE family protein
MSTRALVLSGGGFAGAAWMVGLIEGLRAGGVDLHDADLVVGTSAGARTGAQLATGALGAVAETMRSGRAPRIDTPVGMERFVEASMGIVAETRDGQEAARRIANLAPLGAALAPRGQREAAVAELVPVREWPRRRLAIAAVDAESGARAVFEAGGGVELLDAVLASGALPGIYELTTIAGRRYADGGIHSLYNADLAAGHDVVVIVSPMALNPYFQARLDAERAALGEARVRVVVADERSLAAVGPDPISTATVPAALAAGTAQAEREVASLRLAWSQRSLSSPG